MCYGPYGSISKITPGRKSSTFEIMKKKKKKYISIPFPKDRKFYLIGHLAGTQLGELSSGTETNHDTWIYSQVSYKLNHLLLIGIP